MTEEETEIHVHKTLPPIEERKEEYEQFYCSGDLTKLKERAISGQLKESSLRSLAWKIFLGCLPLTAEIGYKQWKQVLSIHRKEYASLLQQYLIDPRKAAEELDLSVNNPLSQNEQSPWFTFFQNAELEKEIEQDIQRTYPENPFFQQRSVRDLMLRILFIYARQTPQLSYKQGMHELLAPLVYLVDRESIENTVSDSDDKFYDEQEGDSSNALRFLMDKRYIEHDCFVMFSYLMKIVKPWFQQDNKGFGQPPGKKEPVPFGGSNFDDQTSPVVEKCKYIQNVILREKDVNLYQKLIQLSIEPQLYMLRWVRLLLGREFHLEDVMLLWDAMFAYGNKQVTDLKLIDYLSVAMLVYIRQQLLYSDYTGCLRRLFKYPPVEDIHVFVEQAINLHKTQGPLDFPGETNNSPQQQSHNRRDARASAKFLDPLSSAVKMILEEDPQSRQRPSQPRQTYQPASRSVHTNHSAPVVPPTPSPESKQIKSLEGEVSKLKTTQYHMANRLERIVYSLQREIVDSGLYDSTTSDAVLIAIAEMKQIRDILSDLLPVEQFSSNLKTDSEIMNNTFLAVTKENEQPQLSTSLDPLGVLNTKEDE